MTRLSERARAAQILLIEDNHGDALLMQRALRCGGMTNKITVAETAEKGLSILRREGIYAQAARPDIILLDLNLPDMKGQEVLTRIKCDSAFRCIPIIILSSSTAASDIKSCYDSFANGYITKPMAQDVYADIVNRLEAYWFSLMQLPPDQVPETLDQIKVKDAGRLN